MREALRWEYLGLCRYDRALDHQESCWRARKAGGGEVCLALEHPPVVTFGMRTPDAERRPASFLAALGVECVATDRGGFATYHGPGQLVLYPIIDVRARGLGVAAFVAMLEEIMITIAAAFGVRAARHPSGRGVYTSRGKLGAVGIRVRDGVSTHGLALNVNLDLEPFSWITPCGTPGLSVTRLADEGAPHATVADAADVAERVCRRVFSPATAVVAAAGEAAY